MHAKRNFGLDLARAAAIAMVFLAHGMSAFESFGVGVDLFFVLSGFLIGRIYLRAQVDAHEPAGTFTLWSFWGARWFRTLPPYLAALTLYAVAQRRYPTNAVHPYYLAFLQNYVGVDGFGPSWSLCVEEHFYLALPLAGWLLLRALGRRALVWLLPLLAVVPTLVRAVETGRHTLAANWYWRSHLHCEGLILGVWLATLFVDHAERWRAWRPRAVPLAVLPVALLVYQTLLPVQPAAFQAVAFLLYAVGYAAWVRLVYDLRWQPHGRAARTLKASIQGMALASYSIYLVHTLVFTDVRLALSGWPRGPVKSGTILLTGLLAGVVFYFAVERPTIVLRDRLLDAGKRKPALAATSA